MEILRLKHEVNFQALLKFPAKALLELVAASIASYKGTASSETRDLSLVSDPYLECH